MKQEEKKVEEADSKDDVNKKNDVADVQVTTGGSERLNVGRNTSKKKYYELLHKKARDRKGRY